MVHWYLVFSANSIFFYLQFLFTKPFRISSVNISKETETPHTSNNTVLTSLKDLTCDAMFSFAFCTLSPLGESLFKRWGAAVQQAGCGGGGSHGEVWRGLAPRGEAAAHFKHLRTAKCNHVWRELCLHSLHPNHIKGYRTGRYLIDCVHRLCF